ncbi:DUF1659 domain-containing protein (plasmid) [Clostridium botulinum]|uniref:DUF1659 domain-containing protein n=1 Tax=Clostridium botulinum TaxID=1491 RepID=UPI00016BBB6E|nr:DUF1659 domain-containing protein [Clostridium botulinum]EPS51672.1 hypothetical protein CFSAN002368_12188 [Clostridium botulinum A1 str. CFSAN002368]EDT83780.1 conserved hypothetical protein [Clostridium botulinum Bf]MBY6878784.1 DUF1659 domain-containing protein [Clostridium botulinum]MBY6882556.1 DUF1659 domain-containing protein [Clostridium botulinum]MBY6893249.1 DUF1659 domain-containing protein [Clostridium botulinum]
MAVEAISLGRTLILGTQVGYDQKGKAIIKKQRFNKIKDNATDENLMSVGEAIGTLLAGELSEVQKEERHALIQG